MNKDLEYVMFTPEEIHQRVRELARELTEEELAALKAGR